jgi:hypothetical protein
MQNSLHLLPLIAATAFLLFALILVHAIFWGMTFTIDDVHVRVRVYGLTARKVALCDIEWAAQDWVFWNEHWTNTLNPRRMVLLRRRSGVFKSFLISPPSPSDFLRELGARDVAIR